MIKKTGILFVLICVMKAIGAGPLQAQDKSEYTENKLEKIIRDTEIPGMQIVHLKDGVSERYNLGYKKHGTNDKVTAHTLFQSASLSKTVMAYAVLRLYDQGMLDLDTPLDEYYSYSRLNNEPKGTEITARMALTHTSGLPNWTKPRGDTLKVAFKPGTDYKYSGEGYLYLQKVVEELTHKSLEEIAQEEVFKPMGMDESHYIYKDDMEADYANGHSGLGPKSLRKFDEPNGAFSLITTATEYMTFVQKALVKGQGLKPETHAVMMGYSSSRSPRTGYGMGVVIQQNKKGKGVSHTGSNPGFRNFYFVYPDTGESIVCFTNGTNGEKVREEIAKLFLGDQTFWSF